MSHRWGNVDGFMFSGFPEMLNVGYENGGKWVPCGALLKPTTPVSGALHPSKARARDHTHR